MSSCMNLHTQVKTALNILFEGEILISFFIWEGFKFITPTHTHQVEDHVGVAKENHFISIGTFVVYVAFVFVAFILNCYTPF